MTIHTRWRGRRIVVMAVVLTFVLLASMQSAVAQTKVSVGYWDFGADGPDRMRRIVENFNAMQDSIVLEGVPIAGNIKEKVLVRWAAGKAPDVTWWYGPWYPAMIEEGGFLDLSPFVARDYQEEIDDFYPPYLDPMRWKGKLYGLSSAGQASVLYYNRNHFDATGLGYPNETWDWDSMLQSARKLTIREGPKVTRYGVAAFFGPWEGSHALPVIWSNGGRLFDRYENPTESTLTNERVVDSIQWVADLFFEHNVVPHREVYEQNGALAGDTFFIDGTASMIIGNRGPIVLLRNTALFDWDVAQLPKGSTGRSNFLGTSGYSIMSSTQHPDAAWEVLKYLVSPEVVRMNSGGGGSLPTRISLAPIVVADVPPDNSEAFLQAMTVGRAGIARAVNQEELANLFYEALNTVLSGETSAALAMQKLDDLLDDRLSP